MWCFTPVPIYCHADLIDNFRWRNEDIMKIVTSLEESDLKVFAKEWKMKQENRKVDFLACH